MAMRTQRGHRTRDQDLETKEPKRLQHNTVGRWVASKGVDTSECSSRLQGKETKEVVAVVADRDVIAIS